MGKFLVRTLRFAVFFTVWVGVAILISWIVAPHEQIGVGVARSSAFYLFIGIGGPLAVQLRHRILGNPNPEKR